MQFSPRCHTECASVTSSGGLRQASNKWAGLSKKRIAEKSPRDIGSSCGQHRLEVRSIHTSTSSNKLQNIRTLFGPIWVTIYPLLSSRFAFGFLFYSSCLCSLIRFNCLRHFLSSFFVFPALPIYSM